MKDPADTICALSTPPGRSGLAVVRLSGTQAHEIASKIFRVRHDAGRMPMRRAVLGQMINPRDGSEIDEGLATLFRAPHSYTGEDMCELSLHGSPVLIAELLDSLCELGARPAEPGEFTFRAFLNGKMDLSQAEAVRDIIDATTLYQAQVAARQRSGALARELQPARQALIDAIVQLESAVEFEEGAPPGGWQGLAQGTLRMAVEQLGRLADSFRRGRIVRDGFSMAVVGRPNSGKSSLFNALLAQNRSIVAEMPGTTRDLVSEFTSIGGIPVRLLDTAGIRHSECLVEKMGIDRTREAIADADAILLVMDLSRPLSEEDLELRAQLNSFRRITVMNKCDLQSCWDVEQILEFSGNWPHAVVSARSMAGISELRGLILEQLLGKAQGPDGILVTNLRHCRSLEKTKSYIEKAISLIETGESEEYALADLNGALRSLGEITGETGVEDLLSEIFSRFCIGK